MARELDCHPPDITGTDDSVDTLSVAFGHLAVAPRRQCASRLTWEGPVEPLATLGS